MADPINTLYRDALLGLVRYVEVEVGRTTDGVNTPIRIPRSVPSSENGQQLFTPTNPASVTLGSAGAGLALDATLQTIAQAIASFAAANHVDLGALLTRLGQALTVQGSVSVSNLPATQAISATALPLPTGASTATNQATAITNLAGILTALTGTLKIATPLAAPLAGQVKIAVTGTAVQLPAAALVNGLSVKASVFNAVQTKSPAYSGAVGGSGVTTAYDGTGNSFPLAPGEGVNLSVANVNQVYVNGTVGDVFTYSGN